MKSSDSKPSLFAFQDIITSVIGIFVFISILLVLSISVESIAKIEEQKEDQKYDEVDVREKLASLKDKNILLKSKLKNLEESQDFNDKTLYKIKKDKSEIEYISLEIAKIENLTVKNKESKFIENILEIGAKKIKELNLENEQQQILSEQELDNLIKAIKKTKTELDKYKNGAVFISKNINVGTKTPIYIDCTARGFRVINTNEIKTIKEIEQYISSLDVNSYFLQFLFRPSSSHFYLRLIKICNKTKIDHGATVLLEKEEIING